MEFKIGNKNEISNVHICETMKDFRMIDTGWGHFGIEIENKNRREIEIMYMGTESKARKRFQKNNSFRRQPFVRPRSGSRDSHFGNSQRYSRFDGKRSGDDDRNRDRSCTPARSSQTQNFPRCIRCQC